MNYCVGQHSYCSLIWTDSSALQFVADFFKSFHWCNNFDVIDADGNFLGGAFAGGMTIPGMTPPAVQRPWFVAGACGDVDCDQQPAMLVITSHSNEAVNTDPDDKTF